MSQAITRTVNVTNTFARFSNHLNPKVGTQLNELAAKLLKLQDEFIRHQHKMKDEVSLMVNARVDIRLSDRDLHLQEAGIEA